MVYKGIEFEYFDQIFDEGLQLAKTDKKEALEFFKAYIQYIYEDAEDIDSLEAAEERAKRNFGYWAGYYSPEVCKLIYDTFDCEHPFFGKDPYSFSPEEILNKGRQLGEGLKQLEQ